MSIQVRSHQRDSGDGESDSDGDVLTPILGVSTTVKVEAQKGIRINLHHVSFVFLRKAQIDIYKFFYK